MKMMKKILCLFSAFLLLLATLTSCIRFPLYRNDADNDDITGDELDETVNAYEEFEGQPYLITYHPGSAGICTVTDIRINPNYTEDFELIIPERSPDGRLVTRISMSNYEIDGYFHFYPVPRMLTEEDFSELQEIANAKYEQGEITSHELSLFNFMYQKVSYAEEPSDSWKAQLLERYPYAESLTFYALQHFPAEWLEGYGEVLLQLGYTVQDLMEDEENFRRAVEQCEFDNKKTVLKELPFIADRISAHIVGIQIPQSVTTIGSYAFAGCARVQSVSLPNKLMYISDHAFYACTNLRAVEISENVKKIGDYAFAGCESLQSFTPPSGLTSIGRSAFYECRSLYVFRIPDSVTFIGINAFTNCRGLRKNDSNGLSYVDNWLVCCSTDISTASVRSGCVGIAEGVFSGHQSLRSVTLPDSLRIIGESAFQQCESLKRITIPASVTSIGDNAFAGCFRLLEVTNLSSTIEITKGSSGNGYLGYHALDIRKSLNVPSNFWIDENGCTFYENGDECYLISWISPTLKLELPESCHGKPYAIYPYAFANCTHLVRVKIPDGVTSIGEAAFKGLDNLDGITIPEGVTRIGADAFSGCDSLKYVVIPSTVTSIGTDAFAEIPYRCIVYYGGTEIAWDWVSDNSSLETLKRVYFYSVAQPTDNGHYWHYVNGIPTIWE